MNNKKLSQKKIEKLANAYVPMFSRSCEWKTRNKLLDILQHDIPHQPTALHCTSKKQLNQHVSFFQNVVYYHNELVDLHRESNLYEYYPSYCCGTAARNVVSSLLIQGYNQALIFFSSKNHWYAWVPFLLRKKPWCIIIDPTHEQLWIDEWVHVKFWTNRNYSSQERHDWKNLYPKSLCDIEVIKETSNYLFHDLGFHKKPKKYLKNAYKNPKKVDIPIL